MYLVYIENIELQSVCYKKVVLKNAKKKEPFGSLVSSYPADKMGAIEY